MGKDLRYALHGLLASPGFTLFVLAVLALSIGANTAIFQLLDGVLTRNPAGIASPEQLVVLSRANLVALVVVQSIKLVLVGLAAGVPGALALTRLLQGVIFGLSPADLPTYEGVSFVFLLVALAASCIPAHKAARVDPLAALRKQ